MFNYDEAIRDWRNELTQAGLAPAVVQELEEHLREDFAHHLKAGMMPAQAFQAARERIGAPADLNREFDLLESRDFTAILRRHGWKLALCGAIGLAAAIVLPLVRPANFQSEAKLLLRYVIDDAQVDQPGAVRLIPVTMNSRQTAFVDEQIEVLSSSLLAERVAATFGAKKLLAGAGAGDDLGHATSLIQAGLQVRTAKNSSVIHLSFRHPDSTLLQGVLQEVIRQYLQLLAAQRSGSDGSPAPVPRISNVSTIQTPSPPYANSAPLLRIQATFIATGILVGFVWLLVVRFSGSGLRLAR